VPMIRATVIQHKINYINKLTTLRSYRELSTAQLGRQLQLSLSESGSVESDGPQESVNRDALHARNSGLATATRLRNGRYEFDSTQL